MSDTTSSSSKASDQSFVLDDSSNSTTKNENIPQVSKTDRKADIYAAYQDLVKKYAEKASRSKGKEQEAKKMKECEVVNKASEYEVDEILGGISNLELKMRNVFISLSDKLIKQVEKLKEVQNAIEIEKRNMEEVHDIHIQANTLSELMQTYEIKRKEFEQEITGKRGEWKREQEEYNYRVSQERKREEDLYRTRREELEKELKVREEEITSREEEINELRKREEEFDDELAVTIEKIKNETENRVRQEEKVKADLVMAEREKEKELATLKIESLTDNTESQRKEIEFLKTQLENANRASKELAEKVIQGVSGAESLQNMKNIALEQARARGGERGGVDFQTTTERLSYFE